MAQFTGFELNLFGILKLGFGRDQKTEIITICDTNPYDQYLMQVNDASTTTNDAYRTMMSVNNLLAGVVPGANLVTIHIADEV